MNIIKLNIILAFLPIICFSQTDNHNMLRDYANNWKNNTIKSVGIDELKKNISGTPYFDDKFKQAQLIDGTPVPDKLRYNAFSDQMEFMKDDVTYEVNKINNLQIKFPSIQTTYVIKPLVKDKKEILSYLKEIKTGKFSLLQRQSIKLAGGKGINNGLLDNTTQFFSPLKDEYYLAYKDSVVPMPKSIKELSKQLSDWGIESSDNLKLTNVNLKNKTDLIDLVDTLNKM